MVVTPTPDFAWPGAASAAPLDAASANALAHGLQVLADPTRLRILSLVAANPDRPTTVTELVAALGCAQSTASHHLRILVDGGYLSYERSGTWGLYRLEAPRLLETSASIRPR
ncbi:helix-turn-helix transcriptional regulator [Pseudoclavibacter sp. RFBA6]|uniref:ArsR/SmtB family transcription factor n=1 Tax=Pseudoclavibacter sp. RFBA6 TaxID=2080573 RepID=UPI000CE7EE0F|nr:metalloregulator ArsR/SmtB family transcription factor [Pseudoclavibacter sp. RFBA6]PPG38275.1 transcriptional regulator [Pseudoclavibacter sp. RFBA6]